MSLRFTGIIALVLLAGTLGGCPAGSDSPPPTPTPGSFDVTASGPGQPVEAGAAVDLVAAAAPEGSYTYRWVQVFGKSVTLENAESASVRFNAPRQTKQQTLVFRVDAVNASANIASTEISVVVLPDPLLADQQSDEDDNSDDEDDLTPQVRITTTMGDIVVELDAERAPITVRNFLRYVDDGSYDGTIFHRVVAEFVIQGGGYDPNLEPIETLAPIDNEGANGLKNDRGTIAMARTQDPDSATSQFYINLVDNDALNATDNSPGYAVFGRVIEGLDIVDEIGEVEVEERDGFQDVPVEDIVIVTVTRIGKDDDPNAPPDDDGR